MERKDGDLSMLLPLAVMAAGTTVSDGPRPSPATQLLEDHPWLANPDANPRQPLNDGVIARFKSFAKVEGRHGGACDAASLL